MRRLLPAALIGLILVGISSAEPPKTESLKEFVTKNKSRHAVGIYLKNVKVGYMISELDLGKYQDKEVAIDTSEMFLSLLSDGERSVTREREKLYYSLADGAIVYAEKYVLQDKRETNYSVVATAKGMTITTKASGENTTREISQPKASLTNERAMMRWLQSEPKKGETFVHWETSWEENDVDSREVVQYQGKKSILWGGLRTDVYQVRVDVNKAVLEQEILANGDPIRGKLGGLFELRAESEEIATKLDSGEVDMVAASSIKIDYNLGPSQSVTGLTLEATGLDEFILPSSHRQSIRRDNGKVVLDLKADFRVDKASSLSEAEQKKYTSATATIQSDEKKVRKLAAEIVGSETDPLKKAELLKTWVYRSIRKTMACNSNTTLAILDNMAGDCTEHTLLFVSLARAVGLPARPLTGVAHVDGLFGWHAWAEVHDGRQWVSVDPTWNELFVDSTHIVFSNDPDDHAWLNVLGNVSFKLVRMERTGQ
jgi:hypothetical protein